MGRAPCDASSSLPRGKTAQPATSSAVGGTIPARSGSGSEPVRARQDRCQDLHERVGGGQRRTAEHPGVEVAFARCGRSGGSSRSPAAPCRSRAASPSRSRRPARVRRRPRRCPPRPSRRPSGRRSPPRRRSQSGRSRAARRRLRAARSHLSSMKRCALSSAMPRATSLPSRSTSSQGSESHSSSGSGGCTSRCA